ncbi:hypothetical protein PSHT_01968 [Puccinia striiformis]|uniref:Uncharacterized protein n=1 Tax=Puccinia striiformis TaxID=27350 RepID=A0A2S4WJC7_9BASI|nr:hypothetical protein PSHT_01968 [Puccinia striiformis]
MCSYCLLKKQDIKNTDRSSWPMRKLEDHQYWAKQSRDAPDAKSQAKILLDHGVRYSVLLELSYWNILEYHVVDSMHNLLLGLLKWHTQRFWLMSDVDDEPEPRGVSARQLEITCTKNFYVIANLRALLESPSFPPALHPFIQQLKSLYIPIPPTRKTCSKPLTSLDSSLFQNLIDRINVLFPLSANVSWLSSDRWQKLNQKDRLKFALVNSKVNQLENLTFDEVVFSTEESNKNNCVVSLKPNTLATHGIIHGIFKHSRVTPNKVHLTDTWLIIKPLSPVSSTIDQPFAQLGSYNIGLSLRKIEKNTTKCILHIDEVLAHCAWIKYKSGELTHKIDYNCMALVCLDR